MFPHPNTYDAQGKLAQVNDTRFQYDPLGRLSGTTAPNIAAKRFEYERVRIGDLDIDRLSTFLDSTGKSYTYNYAPNNPLPIAVHSYGQPVVTYQWDESGALPRLPGCTTPLATWQFGYLPENDGRLPDTVILTGPVIAKLGYWDLKSLQCKLGYDYLGTVKLIADPFNELVKELVYDSFGNIISETEQQIYFPLGFAGGLCDIATGFVCFGFRDKDIMERLSPYVAVKVTYRSKSHYADTYLETFTSIPALLPNDATQKELDSAYEFAIHILDICHLAGNMPKDLVPDLSNIVAKEAVELALEGWTKDDMKEKSTTKAFQIIVTKILQKLSGFIGGVAGRVLLHPSEANPLSIEEKNETGKIKISTIPFMMIL